MIGTGGGVCRPFFGGVTMMLLTAILFLVLGIFCVATPETI